VDLNEILYGGDDIEDDLYSILFQCRSFNYSKARTFKLMKWVQLLNHLVGLDEIFYGGDDVEGYVDHFKMADV
jgi:hypothetical protein